MVKASLRPVGQTPYGRLAQSFRLSLEARNRAPATVATYLEAVTQFGTFLELLPAPEALADISLISSEHVQRFIAHLIATRSPSTARNRFKSLQVFFRWAVEEEEIASSPMAKLHEPQVPDNPPPVVSLDDLRRLLKACEGRRFPERRDTALILLLLDCGLRRGEVVAIRVDDLDLAQRVVTVHGKGGRMRLVSFQARTAQALDRYLRVRAQHPLAERPELWFGREHVLTGWGLTEILARRSRDAGIGHVHPHQLRHTFAHQWRLAGGDDDSLMQLAGWRSREMLNRYGRSAAGERAREAHRRYSLGDRL